MPSNRVVRLRTDDDAVLRTFHDGIAQIQAELEVSPTFPADVEQAATDAATHARLPDLDRTDIGFVTIDPASSMDLDQALHIERDPDVDDGHVVHYAIADLAAFITPGDALDLEAHQRGETLYGADSTIPLHPTALCEGAASLLPGQVRPALLWTIKVDATGEGTDVQVERARVRSVAKLSYDEAQAAIDDGSAVESLQLLKVVGQRRLDREAARGGISLPLPEQQIDTDGGAWKLRFRSLLPVEQWNAQISLLTGFGAASLMVYARVGLLRTLPPPSSRDLQQLHRTAAALHIDWPAEQLYPDFIRGLDAGRADHAAMVLASTRLLRGSGYVAFDGEVPAEPQHAGLASEYAHVTAPLRRLGDRYAGEVCLALCAGTPVPDWVLIALPGLPKELQRSAGRAHAYERAVLDLVEAGLLAHRVGEEFDGVVLSVHDENDRRGTIMVRSIGVEAPVTGSSPLPLGTDARARLEKADVATRSVEFVVV